MRRAIELARRGAGLASPNPMVGCVIVKNGQVLAEGWHKKFGGDHAEIEALNKLRTPHSPRLRYGVRTLRCATLRTATVYVNLEPCAHRGKTPPCVEALIVAEPKRVVIGMKDPNRLVQGRGIQKLREAGIEVDVGVLKKECLELNEPFAKWIVARKPFVVLKTAITLDGALTLKKGTETPLGCPETMQRVHELRQLYDAIAVGVETVLIDDPRLTSRLSNRRDALSRVSTTRHPVRVVFDTNLRIKENATMFSQSGRTIVFTGPVVSAAKRKRIEGDYKKVEIVPVGLGRDQHLSLKAALSWLGRRGIASLMVEGGATLARNLPRQGLVDKMIIIVTPYACFDPRVPRLFQLGDTRLECKKIHWEAVGDDWWFTGYPLLEIQV